MSLVLLNSTFPNRNICNGEHEIISDRNLVQQIRFWILTLYVDAANYHGSPHNKSH